MSIAEVRNAAAPILRRHGARRAALFGSSARGEARKDSDIDMLVELDDSVSLLAFVGLQQELEQALGRKVDLVEYETVKPAIREQVLREQVPIL
jgi:predicted nucleotidyltransferase